jgi:hypothetical protein
LDPPQVTTERLLFGIRVARGVLLFAMFAAAMLVAAAVIVPTNQALGSTARYACLFAACVALTLLVLNLLALRAWRRARNSRAKD